MLPIGKMDRYIEIQYPKRTKNSFNEDIDNWLAYARVWARAVPLRATERFSSVQERQSKVYAFTIRYIDGIGPEMRIIHNNEAYRITGIAELGRREGLELTAEYLEGSASAV